MTQLNPHGLLFKTHGCSFSQLYDLPKSPVSPFVEHLQREREREKRKEKNTDNKGLFMMSLQHTEPQKT